MTPEIRQFLKQMLIDAGQTGIGEALEEQLIEDLNTRLENRLILVAMQNLPQEKQKELEDISINQGKKEADTESFLKKNIPEYEKIFTGAMVEFRDLYVEASKRK